MGELIERTAAHDSYRAAKAASQSIQQARQFRPDPYLVGFRGNFDKGPVEIEKQGVIRAQTRRRRSPRALFAHGCPAAFNRQRLAEVWRACSANPGA